VKLIVDESDLERWPRNRQPRVADFKPEVRAIMMQVEEVVFTMGLQEKFTLPVKVPKRRKGSK